MKHLSVMAFTAALLPVVAFAGSAATPPSTPLLGSATTGAQVISGRYRCVGQTAGLVNGSGIVAQAFTSTYLSPTPSGPITIDLGYVEYAEHAKVGSRDTFTHNYSGSATLNFSTATNVRIVWDFPFTGAASPGTKALDFSAYSQAYDPAKHLLTLSFQLDFGACSLPVNGIYHG